MRKRTRRASLPVRLARVVLLTLPLCGFGCGRIGDPLPPIPRAPLIVNGLTATQRGNHIILTFPLVRTPQSPRITHISVYRLVENAEAPLGVTQEDFSSRSSVIAEIPGDTLPPRRATITYDDTISLAPVQPPLRYRYAVRIVSNGGTTADFSDYAVLTPNLSIAKPPGKPETSLSQTEITVSWPIPTEDESGAKPANVAGYNIFRRSDAATVKLNPRPLEEPRYIDRGFQFGTEYSYFVRAISLPAGVTNLSAGIESNDSETVSIKPKDTFAPGPPESIKIASINGIVSMFWPSNPEPDLAGYYIYRSEDEALPIAQWVKLTPRVHTPTTFRDDKVTIGKRYFYQISAIDTSGNEGRRSAIVGEQVNP